MAINLQEVNSLHGTPIGKLHLLIILNIETSKQRITDEDFTDGKSKKLDRR